MKEIVAVINRYLLDLSKYKVIRFVTTILFFPTLFATLPASSQSVSPQFIVQFTDPSVHEALKMEPATGNSAVRNRMVLDRTHGQQKLKMLGNELEASVTHIKSLNGADLLEIASNKSAQEILALLQQHRMIDKVQFNKR